MLPMMQQVSVETEEPQTLPDGVELPVRSVPVAVVVGVGVTVSVFFQVRARITSGDDNPPLSA